MRSRAVTGALEIERAEKRIGSSLQAHPAVHVTAGVRAAFDGLDPAELFITSGATLTTDPAPSGAFTLADVADVAVVPGRADGTKCARCWRVLEEVGQGDPDDLCRRCADVLASAGA